MKALVVVVRGLHLGYVGCYGNEWIETPALDHLAAEGIVFDHHFADRPDAAGAAHAWRSGRYDFPSPTAQALIPEDGADLLSLLQQAGIATTLMRVGSPPEGTLEDVLHTLQRLPSAGSALLWLDLATLLPPWNAPQSFRNRHFGEAEDGADEGEAEAEEETELVPLTAPLAVTLEPCDETTFLRLQLSYAGIVTHFDALLGRLLDNLSRRKQLNGLLLVVTADHGLPLGEHGVVGGQRPWLHDELIHIPLMIRLPGAAEAGRRVAALTQPVDLMPTLLDAFGLPLPPAHGHSLLPLLRGEAREVRSYAAAGLQVGEAVEWALRTPEWSFLLPVRPALGDRPRAPELYVKPEDRWEVNNVVQHHLDLAEHLEQTLRGFVEATRRPGPFQPPPLPDVGAELATASNPPLPGGTQP
jgi:arylsulfatase A-like enzyme